MLLLICFGFLITKSTTCPFPGLLLTVTVTSLHPWTSSFPTCFCCHSTRTKTRNSVAWHEKKNVPSQDNVSILALCQRSLQLLLSINNFLSQVKKSPKKYQPLRGRGPHTAFLFCHILQGQNVTWGYKGSSLQPQTVQRVYKQTGECRVGERGGGRNLFFSSNPSTVKWVFLNKFHMVEELQVNSRTYSHQGKNLSLCSLRDFHHSSEPSAQMYRHRWMLR